ncbi:MAG: response regulator, partial [Gammaproteobacteria bacterium]
GQSRADVERARSSCGGWPDLILIDDMLGDRESGLDIAKWLKTSLPSERIVIITGNVDLQRQRELQDSGFRVLLKPTAPHQLRRIVTGATRL